MSEMHGVENSSGNEMKLYSFEEFCERQENFYTIFLPEINSKILGEFQKDNPELAEKLIVEMGVAIKANLAKENPFRVSKIIAEEYRKKGEQISDEKLIKEVSLREVFGQKKAIEPFLADLYEAYLILRKKYSNRELKLKYW
ncbi:MAG: hypothetical protein WC831_03875 [Parcubacteria group bacterium]|jgi:hypothetical protein